MSIKDCEDFFSFSHFPFVSEEYTERNDEIFDFLLHSPVPAETEESLGRVFDELILFSPDRLLAVRSSSVCEDSGSQSMAGVFESSIDVATHADLLLAVRKCYASMFTDRALAQMVRNEIGWENLKMGIVIQPFISGTPSGVLFTADTVTMDPEVIVVNAVDGICADYVHGGKPASLFRLDKSSGRVIQSAVPDKAPQMDERILGMLKEAGTRIEQVFQSPQDIEWTIRDDQLIILQARPITTFRERRFPIVWKNDIDSSYAWRLDDLQYCLTPLQQEIALRANEANNQGAEATGLSQYSWDIMFQNGYIYCRSKRMDDAEKKNAAFSKR